MAIKHWPEGDRPREKLLKQGPRGLSETELLAIFLRTGVRGKSALDLSRELMQRFGSLSALLGATSRSSGRHQGSARRRLRSCKRPSSSPDALWERN